MNKIFRICSIIADSKAFNYAINLTIVFAGILIGIAYHPLNLGFLAMIGLIPLINIFYRYKYEIDIKILEKRLKINGFFGKVINNLYFQKTFTKSLNKQFIHLLTSLEAKIDSDDRIFIPKAIILSSLCFTNMKPKLKLGLKMLSETLTLEILDRGTRGP